MPQCHFPAGKLRKAEKQSLPSLYAKCGFSRKTPQALLFAPTEYGGGGFIHWDTLQGEGQILHFIKHWRTTTVISSTLRINVAWCQWQAGTSTSILSSTGPLEYLEARWLPSLRSALDRFGASIVTDTSFIPNPERENDSYIMDIVHTSRQFSEKDIRIINYCRLYLHLTTISEMFDAAGSQIMGHVVKCCRAPWFDPTLNVAIQRRPSEHQIRTRWARLCKLVQNGQPPQGSWVLPVRVRRESYCIPGDEYSRLYHWYAGSYWESSPARVVDSNLRLTLLRPTTWTPDLTCSAVPIHITSRVHRTIYTAFTSPSYITTPATTDNSKHRSCQFSDHIATLDWWAQHLLRGIQWVCPFDYVCDAFENMSSDLPVLVVSDGSSIEGQHMSYGVTIGLMDGRILVEIMGPASGPPSSHRAECTGCLAGAVFCAELHRFTKRDFSKLTIHAISDNQGMVRSLTDRNS